MDEYQAASWQALAQKYNIPQAIYGYGRSYNFPPHWKNGWIQEANPAKGLFVASAWFTPAQKMVHTVNIKKPCMWILCPDCGKMSFSRQGVPTRTFTPIIHIVHNPQKPFRFTFPRGVHNCFTSVLIFDEFLQPFLQQRADAPKIALDDAKKWRTENYNIPNTMLILEQIRWAVRNADMPLIAFEGMVLHLLSNIARNYPEVPRHRLSRAEYVTWENEQKIYRVKEKIDSDILHPPTIEEMKQLAGMSESRLRANFKNVYRTPLYEYLRTETMKCAMQLLSSDHLSIRSIAEQCGYKNAAKFAAAFKDIHGITPSEFRRSFNL
ncbi:MAG: helix-turn-helix transcriptional regulator [Oscillospiraceae bacterium]